MKRLCTLALPVFTAVFLSACEMPTGYVYHDRLYKKPVAQSTASDAKLISNTQAAQLYAAMADLTARLTERAGLAPRPVYVEPHVPASQIQTMMDNDLRDALRRSGYTLSSDPSSGYVITYRIKTVTLDQDTKNAEISLDIHDGTQDARPLLTSETGFYVIDSLEDLI